MPSYLYHFTLRCTWCGGELKTRRRDAITCSIRCRVAKSRSLKKAQARADQETP